MNTYLIEILSLQTHTHTLDTKHTKKQQQPHSDLFSLDTNHNIQLIIQKRKTNKNK